MRYSVVVSSAPSVEPITLAEAKLHLKVDVDDDDTLIGGLIQAAREWVESHCRRSLVQRTLVMRMDCFPAEIRLPRSPVLSVTSVQYLDENGDTQTLSSSLYQVDLYGTPPSIKPVFGGLWPSPKVGTVNSVLVTYVAGYAEDGTSPTDLASGVPAAIKGAIKLMIGDWYENRQRAEEVSSAVRAILSAFEIRDFSLE